MHQPKATTSERHHFHPSILREYDIRGIVGETVSAIDAYYIGRGFASILIDSGLAAPRLAVARDGRLSSPELANALMQGMQDAGAEVLDAGLGPTPMLYFAVHHLQADGGIMVTGSHNPPSHNGFKIMRGHAPFYGESIRALGELVASGELVGGTGNRTAVDVKPDYVKALLSKGLQSGGTPISAAWDAGNGAAGELIETLIQSLPATQITLFTEIDGTFPNHHPDPSVPKNLADVVQAVTQHACAIGLAFDGDGDRLGVVDEKGRIVSPDHLLMLFARDVLTQHKGTIIADVKTSQTVFDDIAAHGGTPMMWKTGHSHIKTKMKALASPFGGEASGHIFFADRYFGFDDGLYAAMRILNILAHAGQPLSALVDALPTAFSTPEIRIDCDESRKFTIVEEIRARLETAGANFSAIDGVRVNTPDGWWLVRASNTQAIINARAEAQSAQALELVSAALREQLGLSGVTVAL